MGRIRQSYDAKTKLLMVSYAEAHGNRAAGRKYNCGESSIRQWRRVKDRLLKMPKTKKAERGQKAHHPVLEQVLYQWITDRRKQGHTVSVLEIRMQALNTAKSLGIDFFKASMGWMYKFMIRHSPSNKNTSAVPAKHSKTSHARWKEQLKTKNMGTKYKEFKRKDALRQNVYSHSLSAEKVKQDIEKAKRRIRAYRERNIALEKKGYSETAKHRIRAYGERKIAWEKKQLMFTSSSKQKMETDQVKNGRKEITKNKTEGKKEENNKREKIKDAQKIKKKSVSVEKQYEFLTQCSTFQELKKHVKELNLKELPPVSQRTFSQTGKTVDVNSSSIVPDDIPLESTQKLYSAVIYGDGNCLPRSASVLAYGTEERYIEMRQRIVSELVKNKLLYLDNEKMKIGKHELGNENVTKAFASYSSLYNRERLNKLGIKKLFEEEVKQVSKSGKLMGLWQIASLANVLSCPVVSVCPAYGMETARTDMHRVFYPFEERSCANEPVFIMWTNINGSCEAEIEFSFNHLVVLMPLSSSDSDVSLDFPEDVARNDDILDIISSLNMDDQTGDLDKQSTDVSVDNNDLDKESHQSVNKDHSYYKSPERIFEERQCRLLKGGSGCRSVDNDDSYHKTPKVHTDQEDEMPEVLEERCKLWKSEVNRTDILTEDQLERRIIHFRHFADDTRAYLSDKTNPAWLSTPHLGQPETLQSKTPSPILASDCQIRASERKEEQKTMSLIQKCPTIYAKQKNNNILLEENDGCHNVEQMPLPVQTEEIDLPVQTEETDLHVQTEETDIAYEEDWVMSCSSLSDGYLPVKTEDSVDCGTSGSGLPDGFVLGTVPDYEKIPLPVKTEDIDDYGTSGSGLPDGFVLGTVPDYEKIPLPVKTEDIDDCGTSGSGLPDGFVLGTVPDYEKIPLPVKTEDIDDCETSGSGLPDGFVLGTVPDYEKIPLPVKTEDIDDCETSGSGLPDGFVLGTVPDYEKIPLPVKTEDIDDCGTSGSSLPDGFVLGTVPDYEKIPLPVKTEDIDDCGTSGSGLPDGFVLGTVPDYEKIPLPVKTEDIDDCETSGSGLPDGFVLGTVPDYEKIPLPVKTEDIDDCETSGSGLPDGFVLGTVPDYEKIPLPVKTEDIDDCGTSGSSLPDGFVLGTVPDYEKIPLPVKTEDIDDCGTSGSGLPDSFVLGTVPDYEKIPLPVKTEDIDDYGTSGSGLPDGLVIGIVLDYEKIALPVKTEDIDDCGTSGNGLPDGFVIGTVPDYEKMLSEHDYDLPIAHENTHSQITPCTRACDKSTLSNVVSQIQMCTNCTPPHVSSQIQTCRDNTLSKVSSETQTCSDDTLSKVSSQTQTCSDGILSYVSSQIQKCSDGILSHVSSQIQKCSDAILSHVSSQIQTCSDGILSKVSPQTQTCSDGTLSHVSSQILAYRDNSLSHDIVSSQPLSHDIVSSQTQTYSDCALSKVSSQTPTCNNTSSVAETLDHGYSLAAEHTPCDHAIYDTVEYIPEVAEETCCDMNEDVLEFTDAASEQCLTEYSYRRLYDELVLKVKHPFIVTKQGNIKVLQLYEITVKTCLIINRNYNVKLFVHNKPVPMTHQVFGGLFRHTVSVSDVVKLLLRLKLFDICLGNPEVEYMKFVPDQNEIRIDGTTKAFREHDFGAIKGNFSYSATVRSTSCELLLLGKDRCSSCCHVRRILYMKECRR